MSRALVNAVCRSFPGAEVSDPWGGGHDCWKVGGKMFALIGAVMPGVSVKTEGVETAEMLIAAGVGVKAPTCTARGSTCPGALPRTSFATGWPRPTGWCARA